MDPTEYATTTTEALPPCHLVRQVCVGLRARPDSAAPPSPRASRPVPSRCGPFVSASRRPPRQNHPLSNSIAGWGRPNRTRRVAVPGSTQANFPAQCSQPRVDPLALGWTPVKPDRQMPRSLRTTAKEDGASRAQFFFCEEPQQNSVSSPQLAYLTQSEGNRLGVTAAVNLLFLK